jgi:hypothetical protein
MKFVENNLLPNCPITREDIIAAEKTFGPDVGLLKGKTVKHSSTTVNANIVNIPMGIMSQYRNVVIAGDILYISKIPFLITIARKLKFSTADLLPNQSSKSIYIIHGYNLAILVIDGQFESIRGDLAETKTSLNMVSNDEHVPEIERHICHIKERVHCVYKMFPFKRMPSRMIVEMVCYSNFWLNIFPATDGVSETLSPRDELVVGAKIDYVKHCKLEFGTYVKTHEQHNNSMTTRTVGAIAMLLTGKEQGGCYFFSLSTGRILNQNHWTKLPIVSMILLVITLLVVKC